MVRLLGPPFLQWLLLGLGKENDNGGQAGICNDKVVGLVKGFGRPDISLGGLYFYWRAGMS